MISRREILQFGVTGATLLPLASYGGRSGSSRHDSLYKLIVDDRVPDGRAIARRLHGSSTPVAAIHGDITSLWYHDLYFAWQKGPAPIAGVTTAAALFCLETLARDAGLQVTHREVISADLVSWSIGPRSRAR